MKNILLMCALITICTGSFAQTDSTGGNRTKYNDKNKYDDKQRKDMDKKHQENYDIHNDCAITMKNGKMMMVTDGKGVIMDKEMVMQNGAVVTMDGTMKLKDGETMRIQEGDCIDKSGKIIAVKNTQVKENPKNDIK